MTGTAPSDAELLARARHSDRSAFTELYVRHQAAARRVAAAYPPAGDPDDLVNGAFERVLAALERGGGPDDAFRAYLFVTLRRLAAEEIALARDEPVAELPEPVEAETHNPVIDLADRKMVIDAYESLPDRWQSVLWQTAVEGRQPREVAPVLGVSANAASAMAYRARERLRQAYLQAHLQAAPRPECEPHRSRLGAYVRDGLSRRDRGATETHLGDCDACRGLLVELSEINSMLVRSLVPLFASTSHAGAVAVAGGGAGLAAGVSRRLLSKARSNPAVVAATVVAIAGLVAALAGTLIGDDAPGRELVAPVGEVEDETEPPPDEPADEPADAPTTSTAAPDVEPPASTVVPLSTVDIEPQLGVVAPPAAPAPGAPAAGPAAPGSPAPTAPPPTSQPNTPTPTTTTTAPPEPELGPVVWFADRSELQVTLANPDAARTGYLVLTVRLTGGARLDGQVSGCDLTIPLGRTLACGVNPLPAGGNAVVTVPVRVTGSGQKARVSLCAVGFLSVDCDTGILGDTTKDLSPG